MLADLLFGLVAAAFPLPHLPPIEPDFIPAGLLSEAIKLPRNVRILTSFGLVNLGATGLLIAGIWAASRLYSSTSREVKLSPDRSGKTHSEITSEVAAQFSLRDGKDFASTTIPTTAIDHDEAPVQIPPGDGSKPVNIAAFAPPIVAPGDDFCIQIVIHSPEQLADAKADFVGKTRNASALNPKRNGDRRREVTVEFTDRIKHEPAMVPINRKTRPAHFPDRTIIARITKAKVAKTSIASLIIIITPTRTPQAGRVSIRARSCAPPDR